MIDQKNSIVTKVVHAGTEVEPRTGAVMTPIFMTSTYAQTSPGEHKGYDYSRADNPTRAAYEIALAEIESGAKFGLAFASGLAAEQAIIQALVPAKSHVIVCDDVYGGTGRLFRKLFAPYDIEFEFIDMTDLGRVSKSVKSNTLLIWAESPSNPTMKIVDIKGLAGIAKKNKSLLVVDNTFASPIFQSPLLLGADIVLHSTTKYIGGHSDMIGGAVMTADAKLHEKLKFVQFAAGAVPSAFDCFLFLRSIKTLAIRMFKHHENALKIADCLATHPRVGSLYFPGHQSHAQHKLALEQMCGFSGMVSFDLKGDFSDVKKFLAKLKIFKLAESLGGVESLINHPEKMTHASVPEELRKKLGITSQLLRLSVGIEDSKDLINDLEQAMHV